MNKIETKVITIPTYRDVVGAHLQDYATSSNEADFFARKMAVLFTEILR